MKKSMAGLTAFVTLSVLLLSLKAFKASYQVRASADTGAPASAVEPLVSLFSDRSWVNLIGTLVTLSQLQRQLLSAATQAQLPPSPNAALLTARVATTGLGPVRVGMTLAEVAETGLNLLSIDELSQGSCRYYRVEDLVESISFMAVDERVIRIDIWPGGFAETLSGAKIGTTEPELYRLYGERLEVRENPASGGKQLIFTPEDSAEAAHGLVFETDARGTVVRYRAGQFPAITWSEGCF